MEGPRYGMQEVPMANGQTFYVSADSHDEAVEIARNVMRHTVPAVDTDGPRCFAVFTSRGELLTGALAFRAAHAYRDAYRSGAYVDRAPADVAEVSA